MNPPRTEHLIKKKDKPMSHTVLQRLNAASRAVLFGSNGSSCYGRNLLIFFKILKKLSDYYVFLQRD